MKYVITNVDTGAIEFREDTDPAPGRIILTDDQYDGLVSGALVWSNGEITANTDPIVIAVPGKDRTSPLDRLLTVLKDNQVITPEQAVAVAQVSK